LIESKTSPVVLIVFYPLPCPPVTTVSLVVVFSPSFGMALLFCAMTETPLRKEIAKAVVKLPLKSIEINIIFDLDI
jgi:hypothetical protein